MSTDMDTIAEIGEAFRSMKREIHKKIIGQDEVVENLLVSIFAGGHVLLVGVPGLAKTLLVTSLCEALHLDFKRIQFTPDLMPSDIVGTEIIQDDPVTKERMYKFIVIFNYLHSNVMVVLYWYHYAVVIYLLLLLSCFFFFR